MNEHSNISAEKSSSSKRPGLGSPAKAVHRRDITPLSTEERERMIAMAAYYLAEHRGFAPGHELEDWCEAEMEINRQLGRE